MLTNTKVVEPCDGSGTRDVPCYPHLIQPVGQLLVDGLDKMKEVCDLARVRRAELLVELDDNSEADQDVILVLHLGNVANSLWYRSR